MCYIAHAHYNLRVMNKTATIYNKLFGNSSELTICGGNLGKPNAFYNFRFLNLKKNLGSRPFQYFSKKCTLLYSVTTKTIRNPTEIYSNFLIWIHTMKRVKVCVCKKKTLGFFMSCLLRSWKCPQIWLYWLSNQSYIDHNGLGGKKTQ